MSLKRDHVTLFARSFLVGWGGCLIRTALCTEAMERGRAMCNSRIPFESLTRIGVFGNYPLFEASVS